MTRSVLLVLASTTGGTGRHVAALTRELIDDGWSVTVAGPAAVGDAFEFAGASYAPVQIGSRPHPVRDLRAVRALRRLASRSDVVHAHGLRAGLLAGQATGPGVPYVVTWHNAVLGSGPRRLLAVSLARRVARRADVSLAVSADLGQAVRAYGGRDVRLGPVAAADLAPAGRSVDEVRAELGVTDRPLLLAVGRLHPQKGYPTLVEAARLLAVREPPPLVVVAGDGPSRGELQRSLSGAPVRLLGHRDDVADLLAAADVVVLPSIWEGSPLAAQEALRAGRPLVATDVGGTRDMVGGGAVLVPPGDPGALAAAITGLLDDEDARSELLVRARAVELPDVRTVARRVAAVYAELLGVSRGEGSD